MNRRKFARTVLAASLAGAVAAGWTAGAAAQGTIKMGALATLEGPFTVLGQDSMRGVELALKEYNYTAGGKKIELIKGSSNASPDSAVNAARKLVEQDKVQILDRAAVGRRGHRREELRQEPARRHLPQRLVRRARDHAEGPVARTSIASRPTARSGRRVWAPTRCRRATRRSSPSPRIIPSPTPRCRAS